MSPYIHWTGEGGGLSGFWDPIEKVRFSSVCSEPAMLSSSENFGDLSEMFTTQKNMAMLLIVTPRDSFLSKLLSLQEWVFTPSPHVTFCYPHCSNLVCTWGKDLWCRRERLVDAQMLRCARLGFFSPLHLSVLSPSLSTSSRSAFYNLCHHLWPPSYFPVFDESRSVVFLLEQELEFL